MSYDPLSPDVLADPFPAYAELRARCPVHHFDGFAPPFFTLSRHEDVLDALRNWELWSSRHGSNPHYLSPAGLFTDPPEHTGFRKLFNRAFTPRVVERLEAEVVAVTGDLLDAMEPLGTADFHAHVAGPLPTLIIARLLGIPSADRALFKEMCDDLVATYNLPDPTASAAPRARLDEYFQVHIEERRAAVAAGEDVPDDLVSGFVLAETDGRQLTDPEIHLMLLLLLLGGLETSTALLTNLVWRLVEVPARWEAVRGDPALVGLAVEESLRHDPPVLGLFRTPTRDVELHGTSIPAKAKTMLAFASANRDASIGLVDPEAFRLDRDLDQVRQHLSFGFGVHFCPGAALARLEARVVLRMLLERFPDLRLAGTPDRIVPFILWGRRTLPIAWGSAT